MRGAIVAVILLACGQTSQQTDAGADAATDVKTSDVASDGPVDAAIVSAKPPPPPDGGAPTTNVYTFAMNTLYLGEAPRGGGSPSTSAWRNFGYDIDGLATTKSSTNVCKLAQGAPFTNQVDGANGIDNGFGSMILPIIQTAASLPTPSQTITNAMDAGGWTTQFQITGLSDDPAQSALGLSAQIFISGSYGGAPAFDGTTDWPVLTTSVKDGATVASGALVQFGSAYVSHGTFVSGPSPTPFVLPLFGQGQYLPVTIHDAVFTFEHVDHADAANGTIAGTLDTQEFIAALKADAGRISMSLCGSAFDGIAAQIGQAPDILLDGTNTPNVPCSAISIGLGFTAKLVANPTQVAAPVSPIDPCGD